MEPKSTQFYIAIKCANVEEQNSFNLKLTAAFGMWPDQSSNSSNEFHFVINKYKFVGTLFDSANFSFAYSPLTIHIYLH